MRRLQCLVESNKRIRFPLMNAWLVMKVAAPETPLGIAIYSADSAKAVEYPFKLHSFSSHF